MITTNKAFIEKSESTEQSLFEEDYLLRELGQLALSPQIALTELVANAWDAGASRVEIFIPNEIEGVLTVIDDGHGMTSDEFRRRWMTLRYDRLKHQGEYVEFPAGREIKTRRAYGRNGVGRHGLLCFADQYEVETWRDGQLSTFTVGTESGTSPFVLKNERIGEREGSGTKLMVKVERRLPKSDDILTVLSTRFIHDPEFEVYINNSTIKFSEIKGKVSEVTIELDNERSATVIVIDSTKLNHSSVHQGIAFWVKNRLVGTPSWNIAPGFHIDGRTKFAYRYKVIVDTKGFENYVKNDWTGFDDSEVVKQLYEKTMLQIDQVIGELYKELIEESTYDALSKNRSGLIDLGVGARNEVEEFTALVATKHPTISSNLLDTVVKAVINLQKSKSGADLLLKLAELAPDDIDGLDRLLSEWSIKDAMRILDEIDSRLNVIETIRRICNDPNTDELHTLHPLILRSRWLFGPEFESNEYSSNSTLKTVARDLFKKSNVQFVNDKNRPDIVVLADKTTFQITGIESFAPDDPTLVQMQNVLIIELKKGGFEITRNEVNQADNYVQDIASSISDVKYITAWVVGEKISKGTATEKTIGENPVVGRVRATTFGRLVDTANRRMLKLRDMLSSRYDTKTTESLMNRVLSQNVQAPISFSD